MRVNRREFLKSSLAGAALAGLAKSWSPSLVPTVTASTDQNSSRSVLILGAGLAGLAAAQELTRAGHKVTILEARTRPGGRVYTMREPFSDGLHAEAGAARIRDTHAFTLKYVKQFNLKLLPFFPDTGNGIIEIRGKRIVVPAGKSLDINEIPLKFTDEERRLGVGRSIVKYIVAHTSEVGDPLKPDWPPANLAKFEVALSDFVRQQGGSEAIIQLIGLGQDIGAMSALQFLRDTLLSAKATEFFKIDGGNDLLPRALAATMSDKILYGAPIVRIEQDGRGVRAIYLQAGTPRVVSGEYMICTIPLPVLRRIEADPPLSAEKRVAIEELDYFPMARVFLQSRTRFWLARGDSGFANTDDPIEIWDFSRDEPGTRGILGAYTSGRMALKLTYMSPAERTRYMLEMTERVHPGTGENFETSASHSWVDDPWSLGAAVEFKAGQLSAFNKCLPLPEGRIHFAGEHTSPWDGWMNGALESGERAAREIQERT